MNKIELFAKNNAVKNILCLGAHCDDIEIGCGGTLLRLQDEYPDLNFTWVILSSNEQRAIETQQSAKKFIKNQNYKLNILSFRENYFPYIAIEIKEYFDLLKRECNPDLIFTHYHQDYHQDHRLISELTWNTFRSHLILEYLIPKYEGDHGIPNFYVTLSENNVNQKITTIFDSYYSQREKHWFSKETFLAAMRLRGVESLSQSGYAEGFFARKVCY